MRTRTMAAIAAAIALGGLGASLAWALGQGGGWGLGHGGMMGYQPAGAARPVTTMAQARAHAQRFADRRDLRAGEVMQFSRNYYVELTDARGARATEVLVDPQTGAVSIEYGPAMMWNARYGMMGAVRTGMMGRYGSNHAGPMTGMMGVGMMGGADGGYGAMMGGATGAYGGIVGTTGGRGPAYGGMMGLIRAPRSTAAAPAISAARAQRVANRWLDDNQPGLTAGEAEAFPGYFTLHALRAGRISGMLSVNARTGAVMPHWWHGAFIAMTA